MTQTHILTIICDDRSGLVAKIAAAIASYDGNIVECAQFDDRETGKFFMRVEFDLPDGTADQFAASFTATAAQLGFEWTFRSKEVKRRVVIMVSLFDHCLSDILYRVRIGELDMDIVAIISNHPKERLKVDTGVIPYHHFPMQPDGKQEQEARIKQVVNETGADLVILARYMQILSDDLSAFLSGRCINIHHSFLPGFKGAKPYHQAHSKGVKMIGATAHYVTHDLDEGPIISQDVEHSTHADTPEDLVRKGRDIERRVLGRAVRLHLQDRVLLNGNKTVVFRA